MIILFIIIAVLVIAILVILLYCNKPFPEAQAIGEEMTLAGSDYYFYGDSGVGFIIFSGAKTDDLAYAYLAKLLHAGGHTVVIPKQAFHISAFGSKHGLEIMKTNSDIHTWILIGHSLGGMPVSRIAAAQPDHLAGIALLATFASVNLSGLNISALRLTAENDGIMNNANMERYDRNLPEHAATIMLEGANHQGFGAYRSGSGRDKEAAISWKEQNEQTVRLILDFFSEQIREAATG